MQFGKDAIEAIWRRQCGAWERSDAACVQSFLVECLQHDLDPQPHPKAETPRRIDKNI